MVEVITSRFKLFSNPYMVIAVIYFFLNSFLLPEGLLYTAILTPVFLWWLRKEKPLKPFIFFIAITGLYAVVHFWVGVQPYFYLRSWAMAFCSFTFAITVYYFIKKNPGPDAYVEHIALLNLLLIPVAIISLFVHPINEWFWYYKPISPGIQSFPRLKMFTYEASYYSLIFIPVFMYFLLKVMFGKPGNVFVALALVVIPLALSLSFGVILILAITLALVLVLYFKIILNSKRKKQWFFFVLAFIALIAVVVLFVFPDNPVAQRCFNVMNHKDTSIRGRTTDAFFLAWLIAKEKSLLFGGGFGQIKVLGYNLIINYYKYNLDSQAHPVVRIPNTLAETLAMFGVVGLCLQLGLQIFFFAITKTYSNAYRLAIFIFIFIYQFTGSFFFNVAELTLWVIAFTPCFPQFDFKLLKKNAEA
jgi:hypothetical protein